MRVFVIVHCWFEKGADWAYHPDISPELRRRVVMRLSGHLSGEATPLGPIELPGSPPAVILGHRADDPGRASDDKQRRTPVVRLAILKGRPTSDEVHSIRELLTEKLPAERGPDADLWIEWEGSVTPVASPVARPEPETSSSHEQRSGWGATVVAAFAFLVGGLLPLYCAGVLPWSANPPSVSENSGVNKPSNSNVGGSNGIGQATNSAAKIKDIERDVEGLRPLSANSTAIRRKTIDELRMRLGEEFPDQPTTKKKLLQELDYLDWQMVDADLRSAWDDPDKLRLSLSEFGNRQGAWEDHREKEFADWQFYYHRLNDFRVLQRYREEGRLADAEKTGLAIVGTNPTVGAKREFVVADLQARFDVIKREASSWNNWFSQLRKPQKYYITVDSNQANPNDGHFKLELDGASVKEGDTDASPVPGGSRHEYRLLGGFKKYFIMCWYQQPTDLGKPFPQFRLSIRWSTVEYSSDWIPWPRDSRELPVQLKSKENEAVIITVKFTSPNGPEPKTSTPLVPPNAIVPMVPARSGAIP